jgi:hypothetical protein
MKKLSRFYYFIIAWVIFFIFSIIWSVFYPDLCLSDFDENEVGFLTTNSLVKYKSSDCTRGYFTIGVSENDTNKTIRIRKTLLCLYRDVEKGDSLKKKYGEKKFYLKKNNVRNSDYIKYDYRCENACYCKYYLFD